MRPGWIHDARCWSDTASVADPSADVCTVRSITDSWYCCDSKE